MPSLIIFLLKKASFILQVKQKTKINQEITVTRQPLSIWSKLPRGLKPPICSVSLEFGIHSIFEMGVKYNGMYYVPFISKCINYFCEVYILNNLPSFDSSFAVGMLDEYSKNL